MTKTRLTILMALCFFTTVRPATAVLLWGTSPGSDGLSIVDTSTGNHSFVGFHDPDQNRFMTPTTLAVRPSDGAIFIGNNSPVNDEGLAIVDPATGRATRVLSGTVGSLAFGSGDRFFVQMLPNQDTGVTGPLGLIDLATSSLNSLGGPDLNRLAALDFNPSDGFLYGIELNFSPSLLKIDPLDGSVVSTTGVNGLLSSVAGSLVFDLDGNAYVSADASIYDFDIDTATLSNRRLISPLLGSNMPFHGLGLMIPEPSGTALLTVVLGLLVLRRRRSC